VCLALPLRRKTKSAAQMAWPPAANTSTSKHINQQTHPPACIFCGRVDRGSLLHSVPPVQLSMEGGGGHFPTGTPSTQRTVYCLHRRSIHRPYICDAFSRKAVYFYATLARLGVGVVVCGDVLSTERAPPRLHCQWVVSLSYIEDSPQQLPPNSST